MIRISILRTLLYKELLRYRYNWGLLVIVGALVGLAAMISLGKNIEFITGQAGVQPTSCTIYHAPDSVWASYLRRNPPAGDYRIAYRPGRPRDPQVDAYSVAIELFEPGRFIDREQGRASTWVVRYWHQENSAGNIIPFQEWLEAETYRLIGQQPVLRRDIRPVKSGLGEILPLVVSLLVAFALYLPAFNLYISGMGEEREKRLLLALLLSPARPVELVAAKAIFHTTASVLVAATIAGMYRPDILADAWFWYVVTVGSLGYIAIGTIIVSFVQRQTTINTASMLYLFAIASVTMLSRPLPLFNVVRHMMIESYLFKQLHRVVVGNPTMLSDRDQMVALGLLCMLWMAAAVIIFARRGKSIGQARAA